MTAPKPITRAEARILTELLRDGADNRTIARRCNLSEQTVKVHMKRLLDASGCPSRTSLVVEVMRRRVTFTIPKPVSRRRPPIKHGTAGGYRAHMFRDIEPCEPCTVAVKENARANLGRKGVA